MMAATRGDCGTQFTYVPQSPYVPSKLRTLPRGETLRSGKETLYGNL